MKFTRFNNLNKKTKWIVSISAAILVIIVGFFYIKKLQPEYLLNQSMLKK